MSRFQPSPWVFRCFYIFSVDGVENYLRFNISKLDFFGKVPGRFAEVKPEFKPSLSAAVPMGFQVVNNSVYTYPVIWR